MFMKQLSTVRIGTLVLLGGCLLVPVRLVGSQRQRQTRLETGKREHRNPSFGYRIAIPEKLQVKTNSMMGPSMWSISMAAGSMREISIMCGPDLTMRGSLEEAAKSKEGELARVNNKELVERKRIEIGQVPGILLKYRIRDPGASRLFENVTIYRPASPRGVIYNISLWSDPDNYEQDKGVLDQILLSWHFTALSGEATAPDVSTQDFARAAQQLSDTLATPGPDEDSQQLKQILETEGHFTMSGSGYDLKLRTETVQLERCQMSVTTVSDFKLPQGKPLTATTTETFSLRDLDMESIKIESRNDGLWVAAQTVGSQPKVKRVKSDEPTKMFETVRFPLSGREAAERAAAILRRAVTQCGKGTTKPGIKKGP